MEHDRERRHDHGIIQDTTSQRPHAVGKRPRTASLPSSPGPVQRRALPTFPPHSNHEFRGGQAGEELALLHDIARNDAGPPVQHKADPSATAAPAAQGPAARLDETNDEQFPELAPLHAKMNKELGVIRAAAKTEDQGEQRAAMVEDLHASVAPNGASAGGAAGSARGDSKTDPNEKDDKPADDDNEGKASVRHKRRPLGAAVQHKGAASSDAGAVHEAAAAGTAGSHQALPFLAQIQQSFGRHEVSHVRSYVGGAADKANAAMGSLAYTQGDQIAFKGSPDLHTAAHEAAHVVQQRAGISLKGGVGESGDEHECHADAVADRVVQGKSAEDLLDAYAGGGGAPVSGHVQHKKGSPPPPPPSVSFSLPRFMADPHNMKDAELYDFSAISKLSADLRAATYAGSEDAAQPLLDDVNAAWAELQAAYKTGASAILGAVSAIRSTGVLKTNKMSTAMSESFNQLKTQIQNASAAADNLKLVDDKFAEMPSKVDLLKQHDKKAKLEEKKDEDEKELAEAREKDKEERENAEKVKTAIEYGLSGVAAAAVVGEALEAFKLGEQIMMKVKPALKKEGKEIAKTPGFSLIDGIFHSKSTENAVKEKASQTRRDAAAITHLDANISATMKTEFKAIETAVAHENKAKNKDLHEKVQLVEEHMALLGNKEHQKMDGMDGAVAAVFAAVNQHRDTVTPLNMKVLQAISRAPQATQDKPVGFDERRSDMPDLHGKKIGKCRVDGRDDPGNLTPSDLDKLRNGDRGPQWDEITSKLKAYRAAVQRTYEKQHKVSSFDEALENHEWEEPIEDVHDGFDDPVDLTIERYERDKREYEAYIGHIDQMLKWLQQAKVWYDGEKAGKGNKTDNFDWAKIKKDLDEKKQFASGKDMQICKSALDAVNEVYGLSLGGGTNAPIAWDGALK